MQTIEKFLAGAGICLRCREVTGDRDEGFLIPEPRAAKQYLCELHGSNGVSAQPQIHPISVARSTA